MGFVRQVPARARTTTPELQRSAPESIVPGTAEPIRVAVGADPGAPRTAPLPNPLRERIERRVLMSLETVRVHYDSPEAARLNARAFTIGRNIHLGPRQEQHLAHEVWHVVQQEQGRVPPTATVAGTPVNDDARLEREADLMQLPRDVPASPRPPVAQRVVRSKLPKGTLVIVPGGAAGTTIAEVEDGYRVDVGGEEKSFAYDELDIPSSLKSVQGEGWLTAEAHGLREMAISLVHDVPPAKYAYIAIGNSPALLMNYVAAWAQKAPDAFPVSPLILDLPVSAGELGTFARNMNDPDAMNRVSQYFAQYVAPEKLDGRRPALIDWAASGKTLALIGLHLTQYYRSVGAADSAAGMELVTLGESDVTVEKMESELVEATFGGLEPILAGISRRELTAAMRDLRELLEYPEPERIRYVDARIEAVRESLSAARDYLKNPEAAMDKRNVKGFMRKGFVTTRVAVPLEPIVKDTDLEPLVRDVRAAGSSRDPDEGKRVTAQKSALEQLLKRGDDIVGYVERPATKMFREFEGKAKTAYAMLLPYLEQAHPAMRPARALSAAGQPNVKAFIEGMSSRKFKTEFEYSPFKAAAYLNIARGETVRAETDDAKRKRTIEAAQTIFSHFPA